MGILFLNRILARLLTAVVLFRLEAVVATPLATHIAGTLRTSAAWDMRRATSVGMVSNRNGNDD
jgi:hypothetical protein